MDELRDLRVLIGPERLCDALLLCAARGWPTDVTHLVKAAAELALATCVRCGGSAHPGRQCLFANPLPAVPL
jgi:hypothetical protein